jgi:hypothetical protein
MVGVSIRVFFLFASAGGWFQLHYTSAEGDGGRGSFLLLYNTSADFGRFTANLYTSAVF